MRFTWVLAGFLFLAACGGRHTDTGTPCPDADHDGVCDSLDRCPGSPDNVDSDADGVPDGCDVCPGFPDSADSDGDGVPNGCDQCPGVVDGGDSDADGVPDGCDRCPGFDDTQDADHDGVPDGCDVCSGWDDTLDMDGDGLPNGCDVCPGYDDLRDGDADGVPDGCDVCPGSDDTVDSDGDGVPDGCDACPGYGDRADDDHDGVPDGCDQCPGYDDRIDGDFDGVPFGCDICQGYDDHADADADGVPDGCDACSGFDDHADDDHDGVPDGCDQCPGFDDRVDSDFDTVPDGCDQCMGFDDRQDADLDGVPDGCDACPGADDKADADHDGVPDGCDICPGFDDHVDSDGDGVPDGCDVCPGFDDRVDSDGDTVPDGCDTCPGVNDLTAPDADADGVPDACDVCPGFNDKLDADHDGVPDGCDVCPGYDDHLDADGDGVPDGCDICPGYDDHLDVDNDNIPDRCDSCPGVDNLTAPDADADTVPDVCDLCPGADDLADANGDGIPDACPIHVLAVGDLQPDPIADQLTAWGFVVTDASGASLDSSFDYSGYEVVAVLQGAQVADPTHLVDQSQAQDFGIVCQDCGPLTPSLDLASGTDWQQGACTVDDDAWWITKPFALGPLDLSFTYKTLVDPLPSTYTLLSCDQPSLVVHPTNRWLAIPWYGHPAGMPWSHAAALLTWRSYVWASGAEVPPSSIPGPSRHAPVGTAVTLGGCVNHGTAPLTSAWSLDTDGCAAGSLTGADTSSPSLTPTAQGDCVVSLVVTDENGVRSDTSTVTVSAARVAITDQTAAGATVDGTVNGGEYAGGTTGIHDSFGDVIGSGSTLSLNSDDQGQVQIALQSVGDLSDQGVIYIDSVPGGFADTTGLSDTTDALTSAVSATNGTDRVDLVFAPGFQADYALAFDQDGAHLYQLVAGGTLVKVADLPFAPSGVPTAHTWEMRFALSDIGLQPGATFKYFATYLNAATADRADEFQGVQQSTVPAGSIAPGTTTTLAADDFIWFDSYATCE